MQEIITYVARPTATLLGLAAGFQCLAWFLRRPWSPRRAGTLSDVAFFYLHSFFSNAALLIAVVALVRLGLQPPDALRDGLQRLPVVAHAIIAFVLSEVVVYWIHRGLHRLPMWHVHAVHHSSPTLDWLSTYRMHPFEVMAYALVLPMLPWLGISSTACLWVGMLRIVHSPLVHADVPWTFGPLRFVIASPVFHRWHHETAAEAQGKNFASALALCDVVFGTYYCPRGIEPRSFGVPDPVPEGVIRQLAYPLRRGLSAQSNG